MKLSVEIVTSVTLAEWSGYGQFSISHNPGAKVRWHHPNCTQTLQTKHQFNPTNIWIFLNDHQYPDQRYKEQNSLLSSDRN